MPFGNRKKIFYEIFLVQYCHNLKKYHLSENLKFINLQKPKVFGVKFSLREIDIFSPLNYAILSFGKCLNNYISGYQRGGIF